MYKINFLNNTTVTLDGETFQFSTPMDLACFLPFYVEVPTTPLGKARQLTPSEIPEAKGKNLFELLDEAREERRKNQGKRSVRPENEAEAARLTLLDGLYVAIFGTIEDALFFALRDSGATDKTEIIEWAVADMGYPRWFDFLGETPKEIVGFIRSYCYEIFESTRKAVDAVKEAEFAEE